MSLPKKSLAIGLAIGSGVELGLGISGSPEDRLGTLAAAVVFFLIASGLWNGRM